MTTQPHTPTDAEVTRGLWLGLVGVTVFALTLPMTRLATGPVEAPQLSAWFITFARIVIAGTLSVAFLTVTRSRWPQRAHWRPLFLAMLSNALGFPLLLGLALREVPSGHAAVLTALLPLATAALAAWLLHQRARLGFWLCALLGSALAVAFSVLRAWQQGHGLTLTWADGLLLMAVASASFGYIQGARVTPHLGAERVICWMCVMALPAALPAALLTWPETPIRPASWWALGYTGVFSMWAGFFAWFRGLAIGGALRVSQVQLLQPFISILAATLLLGEPLDALTLGFALGVVATVVAGKKLAAPTG